MACAVREVPPTVILVPSTPCIPRPELLAPRAACYRTLSLQHEGVRRAELLLRYGETLTELEKLTTLETVEELDRRAAGEPPMRDGFQGFDPGAPFPEAAMVRRGAVAWGEWAAIHEQLGSHPEADHALVQSVQSLSRVVNAMDLALGRIADQQPDWPGTSSQTDPHDRLRDMIDVFHYAFRELLEAREVDPTVVADGLPVLDRRVQRCLADRAPVVEGSDCDQWRRTARDYGMEPDAVAADVLVRHVQRWLHRLLKDEQVRLLHVLSTWHPYSEHIDEAHLFLAENQHAPGTFWAAQLAYDKAVGSTDRELYLRAAHFGAAVATTVGDNEGALARMRGSIARLEGVPLGGLDIDDELHSLARMMARTLDDGEVETSAGVVPFDNRGVRSLIDKIVTLDLEPHPGGESRARGMLETAAVFLGRSDDNGMGRFEDAAYVYKWLLEQHPLDPSVPAWGRQLSELYRLLERRQAAVEVAVDLAATTGPNSRWWNEQSDQSRAERGKLVENRLLDLGRQLSSEAQAKRGRGGDLDDEAHTWIHLAEKAYQAFLAEGVTPEQAGRAWHDLRLLYLWTGRNEEAYDAARRCARMTTTASDDQRACLEDALGVANTLRRSEEEADPLPSPEQTEVSPLTAHEEALLDATDALAEALPDHAGIAEGLQASASVLHLRNHHERAQPYIERFIDRRPGTEAAREAALFLLQGLVERGRLEEVADRARAFATDPRLTAYSDEFARQASEATFLQAENRANAASTRLELATIYADAADELRGTSLGATALFRSARACLSVQETETATQRFKSYLQQYPEGSDRLQVHLGLAEAAELSLDTATASRHLQDFIAEVDPERADAELAATWLNAAVRAARYEEASGRLDTSAKVWARVAATGGPESRVAATAELARVQVADGRLDDAVASWLVLEGAREAPLRAIGPLAAGLVDPSTAEADKRIRLGLQRVERLRGPISDGLAAEVQTWAERARLQGLAARAERFADEVWLPRTGEPYCEPVEVITNSVVAAIDRRAKTAVERLISDRTNLIDDLGRLGTARKSAQQIGARVVAAQVEAHVGDAFQESCPPGYLDDNQSFVYRERMRERAYEADERAVMLLAPIFDPSTPGLDLAERLNDPEARPWLDAARILLFDLDRDDARAMLQLGRDSDVMELLMQSPGGWISGTGERPLPPSREIARKALLRRPPRLDIEATEPFQVFLDDVSFGEGPVSVLVPFSDVKGRIVTAEKSVTFQLASLVRGRIAPRSWYRLRWDVASNSLEVEEIR